MSIPSLIAGEPAVLRDGSAVDVRPTTPADLDELARFHEGLSDESRLMRFLSLGIDVEESVRRLLAPGVVGLLALAGPRIVGHACLVPMRANRAELAFAVADDWQHRGIATALLERLVDEAESLGLTTLTAEVHPANQRMLRVFRDAGLPLTIEAGADTVHIEMPAGVGREAHARFEARRRLAAVAGIDHVLRPQSIAVIGASDRRGSVGGELLRKVLAGGFTGDVHTVRPAGGEVAGLRALTSPAELPAAVDLAVVTAPADAVLGIAEACAEAGVRALVVVSAGFGESGPAGQRRQDRLRDVCRAAGMRLVGPNCLGVVNTDPAIRLDATFAPQHVPPGRVGLASQSGAVGIVAMDAASRRGIGLSSFVSLGDRADVSSNDLLRYWADDPRTFVIALYLESFGNPRAFADVAREVAAVKPIVAVKAGRTAAGRRAAASHTGAIVEGSDVLTDVLMADAGVIRVETVSELLDVATVLDRGGAPAGPRVAVLTNAGGGGIACADAAEAAGLRLPRLRAATRLKLHGVRPQAAVDNPVDVLADASPEDYGRALDLVAADPNVDAVIAIHIPPLAGRDDDTMAVIGRHAPGEPVPVIAVPLAQDPPPGLAERVAVLATPEDAARALGRAAAHAERRARPGDPPVRPGRIDRVAGAAVVARALADARPEDGGWLAPEAAGRLARAYGIPLVAAAQATSAADVEGVAAALQPPLVVKALVPGLTHKTERGAVRLGVGTRAAAADAAAELEARLGAQGLVVTGFLVQEQVTGGVELLVGAMSHPMFGPVVLCGAGGVTAELWQDVQLRLAPVGRRTAAQMVAGLRCSALLRGWRGAPPVKRGAVEDVVRRVAALAADRPEIAELECNPLLATPAGAVAADLRVRIAIPEGAPA
ncbi:MAG TPA: GNAT family N-acetyltransferase [Baekduia sp.]|nr:GNAT family N-acetyltransferase [Baekduia sp.]